MKIVRIMIRDNNVANKKKKFLSLDCNAIIIIFLLLYYYKRRSEECEEELDDNKFTVLKIL